ncbi:MAG: DinB family protein [Bacteroidia bacterium]
MKKILSRLVTEVEEARKRFVNTAVNFTHEQGNFKPSPDVWSAAEITEHLVYAEFGGICGMYIALEKVKNGLRTWEEENPHKGLSIEEIISRTWREKETVPDPASPRMGGSLAFWITALESNKQVLEKLTANLDGINLEDTIQAHPISGPMDIRQRYEFLRFHIDRHREQVIRLHQQEEFPSKGEKYFI